MLTRWISFGSLGAFILLGPLGLSSCGSGAPGGALKSVYGAPSGVPVGSSGDDLWWGEQIAGEDGTADVRISHRTDGALREVPMPTDLKILTTMVSAGPGKMWVIGSPDGKRLVVVQVDAEGQVLSDRSEDFEVFENEDTYGVATARSGHGGVILDLSTGAGRRLYRLHGEAFELMTIPEGTGSPIPLTVRGEDDIWFERNYILVHYEDGTWTDIPNSIPPQSPRLLTFDDSGVGYSLASGVVEYEGPYTDGIAAKVFTSIQRIENNQVETLRLELEGPYRQNNYAVSVIGVLAKPDGGFAWLGGMERGGAFTKESWVVARAGDTTSIAAADTSLYYFGDTCTASCSSPASLADVLEDGTFLLNAGPSTEHGGAIHMLVGSAEDLP